MESIYQEGAVEKEEYSHCPNNSTQVQREWEKLLLPFLLSSLKFLECLLWIKPNIKTQGKVVWVIQFIRVRLLTDKVGEGRVALGM